MTQESLIFTIGVDPSSMATGLAKARDLLTSSLKAMGTAAQKEVSAIGSAIANIKAFDGAAAKVDALRTALGAARTESERLGNAWRQTQGDLARLNGQIEAAKKALQELRAIPVNLRTEGQKAEIDRLVQSIQKLTGQASELRTFSTGFARDSSQAAQAVTRLNAELSTETAGLTRLRTSLQQAGVDTGKLATEQARLVEQMNRVTQAGRDLQKITNARQILGLPTVPQNAEREVTRLQAAYERLRLSGTLSGVALAQAHTQMTQGIIAVRNGADSLVERLGLVRDQALKLAAAGALIASATKEAINFESSMANVRKVVDFETPKAFEEMRDQIVAMSREIPVTVNGLAAIATTGGQMGIAAGSMREFTELVAKMATAFNQTPEEVSAAVGKMMNVFALTVPQTRLLADAINHLGNNTNAVEKDIVEVMNRVGGMARVFGLANVETAALATTFLSMGLGPERAATAINALLRELATAPTQTADFKAALLGLGITGEQMAEMIKAGPQKAIIDLLTLISKLDDQAKMTTLVGLFGKQYSDEIVQVVNNMAKYHEILGLVSERSNYAGSMQKEFNERIKTTKAQIELAKNAITEAGIALGNGFLPVITLGAKVVATLAQGVANLVNTFPNLSAAVVTAVAAFSGFGALRLIWSVVSGGVTALGVSLGGLTARAIAMVAPFAQVTTGWIALGSAVGAISNLMTAATARVVGMTLPVVTLGGALGVLTNVARALMLTPLGIFLTAASVAAWAWSKATESTVKPLQDSAKAMGDARVATALKIKTLEELKNTLESTKPGTKAHIDAEQKLAELLPGANLSLDEQGRALARVGTAAKDNTATLKTYLASLKTEDQQNFSLHLDMQARAFLAAKTEMTAYSDDLKNRYGFSSDQAASLTQQFFLKLDRLTGSYDSNIVKGAELRRQLGETETGFKALVREAISTGMSLDQLDKELAKIRVDPAVRAQILDMFTSMTGSITAGKTASKDLNEELKTMNANLAGPLISATQAVNGAIKAADEQIKKYDESLGKSRETLKAAVEDASKSWQAIAASAAQSSKQVTQVIEDGFTRQRAGLQRMAADFEISERDKLAKLTRITIEESQAKINEERRYLAEATRINDQEYQLKIANATRLKQDATRLDEERLQSQRKILEQTEAAYRTTIDKLIGEEQRLLDNAKRLKEAYHDFHMSMEERLARLDEKNMSESQARRNQLYRYEQELATARERLREGDYEDARKHAEKAMSLAEQTAHVIKDGDRVIVTEHDAVVAARNRVLQAGKLVLQANEEEAEASKNAAAAIRKQYEKLGEDLEGVIGRIDKVDAALSRDHHLILTADTEKVKQAAAEVDDLLEKKERVVKVRAELMDVSKELQNVRENIANGLVEPVQQGFDKMTRAFNAFAGLFKSFDPTITFDVRSAQSSIESLKEKFTSLKERFKEKSTLQIDASDADPVLVKLQEILRRMETIDGKRIEYTIVQHTVETHASGGLVGSIARFAGGGHLPGFGGGDRIPALLEAGEFVIPKEAVRHYGLELMVAIQRMRLSWSRIPQFQTGGLVRHLFIPEIPAYATGGSVVARRPLPMPGIDSQLYQNQTSASYQQAQPQRIDIRLNDQPVSQSWEVEDQVRALVDSLSKRLAARTPTRRLR